MLIEHVKIGPSGRVLIPAHLRKSLGMKDGDTLVVESDGDSLLVRTLHSLVKESQAYFSQFKQEGVSAVDELIAERREEFRREQEEDQHCLDQYQRVTNNRS
jgi:AbrB family transcriptional regulator, stage V sporulation protein T